MANKFGREKQKDYNDFLKVLNKMSDEMNLKLTTKRLNLIKNYFTETDETAQPVIKKIHKPGKAIANRLYGLYENEVGGKKAIIEYEPDSDLRDTEQIPLLEKGGIEAFFKREVLSFASDAWIDADRILIGYEISFTKYFYKPTEMRTLEEIRAEIISLETETDGLLDEIIGR